MSIKNEYLSVIKSKYLSLLSEDNINTHFIEKMFIERMNDEQYQDILVEIFVEKNKEKNINNNFGHIFVFLEFKTQFDIINKIIESVNRKYIDNKIEIINIKKSLYELIIKNCEKYYYLSDALTYKDYLDQIHNNIHSKKQENHFSKKEDDGLWNYFSKIENIDDEYEIDYVVENKKKTENKKIERNPTKLAEIILNNREINSETIDYLEKNKKFFNALLISVYSKFLLKEVYKTENNIDNIKNLFLFFNNLSNKNSRLFRLSVNSFNDFLKSQNNYHFFTSKNQQIINNIMSEIGFKKNDIAYIRNIYKFENDELKENNFRSREVNNQNKALYEKIINDYFENSFWNNQFEKYKDDNYFIECFIDKTFENHNSDIFLKEIEEEAIKNNIDIYDDAKEEENKIIKELIDNNNLLNKLICRMDKLINVFNILPKNKKILFFTIMRDVFKRKKFELKINNIIITSIMHKLIMQFLRNIQDEEEKSMIKKLMIKVFI